MWVRLRASVRQLCRQLGKVCRGETWPSERCRRREGRTFYALGFGNCESGAALMSGFSRDWRHAASFCGLNLHMVGENFFRVDIVYFYLGNGYVCLDTPVCLYTPFISGGKGLLFVYSF